MTQYYRLAKILTRKRGATSMDIATQARTVSPHSRLAEMRRAGGLSGARPFRARPTGGISERHQLASSLLTSSRNMSYDCLVIAGKHDKTSSIEALKASTLWPGNGPMLPGRESKTLRAFSLEYRGR